MSTFPQASLERAAPRAARGLAWGLWAAALALMLAALAFDLLRTRAEFPGGVLAPGAASRLAAGLLGVLLILFVASVGLMIAVRRPRNAIGWMFGGAGLGMGLVAWAESFARYAMPYWPGGIPLAAALAAIAVVFQGGVLIAAFAFLFLLFPDGRLPSPRWRWVAQLIGGAALLSALLDLAQPGPIEAMGLSLVNPFGIPIVAELHPRLTPLLFVALVGGLLASVIALLRRFRRSRGVERQQLKWLAAAGGLTGAAFVAAPFIWASPSLSATPLWPALFGVAAITLPLAILIAIVNHDLYDIDVILNRTLVYGALTLVLGLFYFGSVVLLQRLFLTVTGQRSPLAVIISTLAIAMLFTPLRGSLQESIDRRFYRRKYNAERILALFSLTLRDEVDLDELGDRLLTVVDATMQPATLSLWLRRR